MVSYRAASGPLCGEDLTQTAVYCQPGGTCTNASTIACSNYSTSYHAYRAASGPLCGADLTQTAVYSKHGRPCTKASELGW